MEFAFARLLKSEQQTQQRALAAAAPSDDGDELAGGNVQIDAPQYLLLSKRFPQVTNRHSDAPGPDVCNNGIRLNGVRREFEEVVSADECLDRHVLTLPGS